MLYVVVEGGEPASILGKCQHSVRHDYEAFLDMCHEGLVVRNTTYHNDHQRLPNAVIGLGVQMLQRIKLEFIWLLDNGESKEMTA